jgi:serine/threonine-protein kinase SBK
VFLFLADNSPEDEALCPSMYSFHSSAEEKNQLLFTLTQYGIETTVDRSAKKDRIRDWIQASVITEVPDEENHEEEDKEEEEEEEERQKERKAMEGKRETRHKAHKETPTSTNRSASH